jgi:ankyrin repeat protein
MKNHMIIAMIALILLPWETEIKAQTDTQAEKLINTLKAKDCTAANLLAQSVKSVDYMNEYDGSLLMNASIYGCNDVVKTLLDRGANINLQMSRGGTALFVACWLWQTEVVRLLLERGAKVDLDSLKYMSPLQVSSQVGHTEAVKLLLDKGAKVDWQDSFGNTSLQAASSGGHIEIVRCLLDKGGQNMD